MLPLLLSVIAIVCKSQKRFKSIICVTNEILILPFIDMVLHCCLTEKGFNVLNKKQ